MTAGLHALAALRRARGGGTLAGMGTRTVIGAVLVLVGCAGGDDDAPASAAPMGVPSAGAGGGMLTTSEEAWQLAGFELGAEHTANTWACECLALEDSEPSDASPAGAVEGAWSPWALDTPPCASAFTAADAIGKQLCQQEADDYCLCTCERQAATCRTRTLEPCPRPMIGPVAPEGCVP